MVPDFAQSTHGIRNIFADIRNVPTTSVLCEGVVKVYPIECYVQRQQLKFLWKILHLDDMAPQKIVLLHGKSDPKYSRGRGGRQRTYNQCIKDALGNFGVTMAQCIDLERQDWMQSSKEPD